MTAGKVHISSGGIIYRIFPKNQIKILLLYRKKTDSWHLPKGTREGNESLTETALREVREETGLNVKIEKHLGSLPSTYKSKDKTIPKITHYYLMKPVGGSLEIYDHKEKYDKLEWINIKKAKKLLSQFKKWEKEENIVERAEQVI